MYCISCGVENLKRAEICKRCGKPLTHAIDSRDDSAPLHKHEILDRVFLISVYYGFLEWFVAKINAVQVRARNMEGDTRRDQTAVKNAKRRARFILNLGFALILLYVLTKLLGILI